MTYTLVSKKDSWVMRLIGFFNRSFTERFWTTIGDKIYYPTSITQPEKYLSIIEHELVHIRQFKKYGKTLFLFLYIFFPLPMFFSYFRWKFEREAYLVDINQYRVGAYKLKAIESISNMLWWSYGFCWPRFLMKRWFLKQIGEQSEED